MLLPSNIPCNPILPRGSCELYEWLIQTLSVSLILVLGNCGDWWAQGLGTCSTCRPQSVPCDCLVSSVGPDTTQHPGASAVPSLGTASSCKEGRGARRLHRFCTWRTCSLQSWLVSVLSCFLSPSFLNRLPNKHFIFALWSCRVWSSFCYWPSH